MTNQKWNERNKLTFLRPSSATGGGLETPQTPFARSQEETIPAQESATTAETNSVSNEKTAVAAGNSSENMGTAQTQGGTEHMELRDATAEMIQSENPDAAQAIANAAREAALTAERERVAKIRKLSYKGAKWDAMRDKAIEDGTTVEAYLEAISAEKEKEGQTYLEARTAETANANNIGAGDSGDNGKDAKAEQDKVAKELATLADGMSVHVDSMY
jgi:hypothetical protein